MPWQDLVLTLAALTFIVAFLPEVLERKFYPITTSAPTLMGLVAVAIVFGSMNLYFSTIVVVVAATLWAKLLMVEIEERRQRGR